MVSDHITFPEKTTIVEGGQRHEVNWWVDYGQDQMTYDIFVTRTTFHLISTTDPKWRGSNIALPDPDNPGYSRQWEATELFYLDEDGSWVQLERRDGFYERPAYALRLRAEMVNAMYSYGMLEHESTSSVADALKDFVVRLIVGVGRMMETPEPAAP